MLLLRRLAVAFLLVGGHAGCLSTSPTAALIVKPPDPTPLAKCSVKKSQASPLVTEWPASEKAHLEGMLSDRAVVVAYSGCEMRILDACRVAGGYRFTRTTLSRDTIEINNTDDLYAKIPLGAVSLEGELERSGRLAVRTTIAGQMRLGGDMPSVPDKAACRDATHIISAMSVGAFELVSGGAVKGRAGVSVGVFLEPVARGELAVVVPPLPGGAKSRLDHPSARKRPIATYSRSLTNRGPARATVRAIPNRRSRARSSSTSSRRTRASGGCCWQVMERCCASCRARVASPVAAATGSSSTPKGAKTSKSSKCPTTSAIRPAAR